MYNDWGQLPPTCAPMAHDSWILEGHPGGHWNILWNAVMLERIGELPVKDQLRQRWLQWLHGSYLEDARESHPETVKCWPSGMRAPVGAPLWWRVNRGLVGVTDLQRLMKDHLDGVLQFTN